MLDVGVQPGDEILIGCQSLAREAVRMSRFVLQGGGRYGFDAGGAALQAHSLVTLQVEQACLSIARKGLEEFVQEAHQRFAAATGLRRGDELAAGDVDKPGGCHCAGDRASAAAGPRRPVPARPRPHEAVPAMNRRGHCGAARQSRERGSTMAQGREAPSQATASAAIPAPRASVLTPGRLLRVAAAKLNELRQLHRLCEQPTLGHVATLAPQPVGLRLCFDALGNHLDIDSPRKIDDQSHDLAAQFIGLDAGHEGPIDLEMIGRQIEQILQRRHAGSGKSSMATKPPAHGAS